MEGHSILFKLLLIVTVVFKFTMSLEEVGEMEMDSFEKDKVLTCLQVVSKRHQIDAVCFSLSRISLTS